MSESTCTVQAECRDERPTRLVSKAPRLETRPEQHFAANIAMCEGTRRPKKKMRQKPIGNKNRGRCSRRFNSQARFGQAAGIRVRADSAWMDEMDGFKSGVGQVVTSCMPAPFRMRGRASEHRVELSAEPSESSTEFPALHKGMVSSRIHLTTHLGFQYTKQSHKSPDIGYLLLCELYMRLELTFDYSSSPSSTVYRIFGMVGGSGS